MAGKLAAKSHGRDSRRQVLLKKWNPKAKDMVEVTPDESAVASTTVSGDLGLDQDFVSMQFGLN
jgi:hypothetical protein